MSRRLFYCLALSFALASTPLPAGYSELQLVGASIADHQITLHVGNPTTSAESARIQVSVRVADGSIEVLTTSAITVGGSTASTVTVSTAATIVEIIDDPQPISP